ncbi:MAG: tRNA (adenosine(37)-N6)-threonylcarbamoyltransferase complex dimerization subunit type 1 TsaB [Sediminibacterium sp.]
MATFLLIYTATAHASVCLSKDGNVLGSLETSDQKSHASFMQPAIDSLCKQTGIALSSIDAIAISIGPGSYTGLRVGMATAKGIAYAMGKPLIGINTLQIIAAAAKLKYPTHHATICALLDARRMEVFTGIYTHNLIATSPSTALILDAHSFENELAKAPILFVGDGVEKFKAICEHPNAHFDAGLTYGVADMLGLTEKAFALADFLDLAYCEPLYIKAFHDTRKA